MTTSVPRIEMTDIEKRYGGVRALKGASLTVAPGSVHALIGENGAGKSTMIKILSGLETPDAGEIRLDGELVALSSPSDAMKLGVRTVYQEPELVPELTVTENIFLGRELSRGGRISWREQGEAVQKVLALIEFPAKRAAAPVRTLSIAERQQVSIAKAVADEAKILILDEPSAILTDSEIERLFGIVRRLSDHGVAVIYITHRLDEVFQICDTITVLRDGLEVTSTKTEQSDMRQVINWMVGDVKAAHHVTRTSSGKPVLDARNIGFSADGPYNDITVSQGEIVGLYGLLGSGAFEFLDACYGLRPQFGGQIEISGRPRSISSPAGAKSARIAMVPADRGSQALFSFQNITFNISVRELQEFSTWGILDINKERRRSEELIEALRVKTPSASQAVSAMSGGNAQKVVMARQMVVPPELLLLAEPTQGVDVGAKEEIHRLIEQLAANGTGVLMATTDLTELARMADRVLVFRDGAIVDQFYPGFHQSQLLEAASGITADAKEAKQ